MATKNGWWAAILVLGLAVGCGDNGGGGSNSAGGPSAVQKSSGQTANAAANSVSVAQDAANDVLVESGAPGATSAKTGSQKSSTAATAISYQASVTLTVDLDVLNGQGQDAFPNACAFKYSRRPSWNGSAPTSVSS